MLKEENKLGLFDHTDASHPDFVVKMGSWFKNFGAFITILNDSVLAVRWISIDSVESRVFC